MTSFSPFEPTDSSEPSNPKHQTLWAPWRIAYIRDNIKKKEANKKEGSKEEDSKKIAKPVSSGCFLCDYLQDDHDAENLVVLRTELSVVVLNRFPYNNGHLLIAPKKHVGSLASLSEEELFDCTKLLKKMTAALENLMKPQGFNIGLNLGHAAGAGLPGHLHWHIVPRWIGDTNFMDVTAQTNVIPESLASLYELLQEQLS